MAVNFHHLESKCLVTLSNCHGSGQLICVYEIKPSKGLDIMCRDTSDAITY